MEIRRISPADFPKVQRELVRLLIACVQEGASIGFLPPLSPAAAAAYWASVHQALLSGNRRLLIAHHSTGLAGTVQVDLVSRPNGSHRCEILKLMVDGSRRGKGIGRQLMLAAEILAVEENRSLAVLDTRAGDEASHLYRKLGYLEAGQIPDYAINADGSLAATVIFYKRL